MQAINDRLDIQQTISLYSEGCSVRDWDQVMGTFLPDGIWEVPRRGITITGHDALRAAMSAMVATFDHFVQINAPAIITLDGDCATARSLIRECGKHAGRAEALEVMGRYSDELVRTGNGWKFAKRTFEGLGLQGFSLIPPILPSQQAGVSD